MKRLFELHCLAAWALLSLISVNAANAKPHGLRAVTGSVFVIVMENKDWLDVQGKPDAPFINGLLRHPQSAWATQYYNPPLLHPSKPNYLWMEAGSNFGIHDDQDPIAAANQLRGRDHLVKQLEAAHLTWKTYQEDIGGNECPLVSKRPYAAKHNPFVFFDDVTDNFRTDSRYCIEHVRPFNELPKDLAGNNMARYVFITPNLCNDMHDTCPPLNDSLKQGDDWLRDHVPAILNSKPYQANGALIVTWDEGGHSDGPIGFILLSPRAKGHGYASAIHYTHGSLLRTLEEIFGVPLLNDAATQTDLADLFK